MNKTIKKGDQVSIYYKGLLSDGSEFDSTKKGSPFSFKAGSNEFLKAFNLAIIGMKKGEKKTITLPPEKAYGEVDEELIFPIEKELLPFDVNIDDIIEDKESDSLWVVDSISEDGKTVFIDTNHFLAGNTLTFEIEIVDVK